MQGVTAAIVAYIFLALAMPSLIKEKKQYYGGLIAVLAVIFLDTLGHMVPAEAGSFRAFVYVMGGLFQIVAIIMLVLATGGMSFRELKGDVIEVVRRGETEKEIIIPLSGAARKKAEDAAETPPRRAPAAEEEVIHQTYTINDPATPPQPTETTHPSGPIPLE